MENAPSVLEHAEMYNNPKSLHEELTWDQAVTILQESISPRLKMGNLSPNWDFQEGKKLLYYGYPVPNNVYTAAVENICKEKGAKEHVVGAMYMTQNIVKRARLELGKDMIDMTEVLTLVPESLKNAVPDQFANEKICRVFAFVFCKRIRNDLVTSEAAQRVRALLVDLFGTGTGWTPSPPRWFFGGTEYVKSVQPDNPHAKRLQRALDFVAANTKTRQIEDPVKPTLR